MFKNLSLNHKIIAVQCISLLLLVSVLAFSGLELFDLTERNKQSIQNANDTVSVMIQLDNMNFAVLREAKAAKDVWLRGTDPDEKEKATAEFNDQVDNFLTHQAIAEEKLGVLIKEDASFEVFSSGLKSVTDAHKIMSDKYLAQIKVHVSTTESDGKVKGIDRGLFRQLQELRSNFVKTVEKKGLDNAVEIDQQFKMRLKILGGVALLAIVLLLAVSAMFVRSVAKQLGGDPQDVLAVVKNMASGNLLLEAHKEPACVQ
jgi:hypothetical protein